MVNVEGDLTHHDTFISSQAVAAADRGDFLSWFQNDFQEDLVRQRWGSKWESCRRYFDSLSLCQPEAFLANAREILTRNKARNGRDDSEIGEMFASLRLPKIFCWGNESLNPETRSYLKNNSAIPSRCFEGAFYWPMIDRRRAFYRFLRSFSWRTAAGSANSTGRPLAAGRT